MTGAGAETLHASAIALGGAGLLILGGSGRGKSSLALALIARGAALVADDRVLLRPGPDAPLASAPPQLAGLIESRGVGLLRLPHLAEAPVRLVADLDRAAAGRMPSLGRLRLLGHDLPRIMARDRPGLADVLAVLLTGGELVDPDRMQERG